MWLGAITLVLLAAGGIYLFGGFGRGAIRQAHQSALEKALEESARQRAQEDPFRVEVDPQDLGAVEGLPEDWQHILLLGTDMGSEQKTHGRTDAMLVLSVHQETGQMKLTSLIRDMLVDIPGASRGDKLNAANAYGGPLLAVKTVNHMLRLNIQRYCLADFHGFAQVVDLLGGVQLALTDKEAREVGHPAEEGVHHLNGWQALTYARIRRLDSNFGRNERQRKLLEALLQVGRGLDTNTLMDTMAQGFEHLATNLTTQEVLALVAVAMQNNAPLEMLSLPPEGKYRYTTTRDGTSAVGFNQDTVRSAFFDFVYGQAAQADAPAAP